MTTPAPEPPEVEAAELAAANCSPNQHWKTCSLCNYDTHDCPGCGAPTGHVNDNQREVCAECSNRLAADELAAAESWLSRAASGYSIGEGYPLQAEIILDEYDRMRAELTSLHRQSDSSERAANGFYAHAAAMELQRDEARADLARALPVVEAAGALDVKWRESNWIQDDTREYSGEFADLLDALATAVRAAREPRTGEQT